MNKIMVILACCAITGCNAKLEETNQNISDAGSCDSGSENTASCCYPPQGCHMADSSTNVCSDGCNLCSCFEGNWACTAMACLVEDASVGICLNPPEGCIMRTDSSYLCDIDCNVCSCNQGDWMCTARACPTR